ncbi:MAG: YlxR family protein [Leptolyngbyaceae cyanobacterium bins.302]|nr:YlxR family protein [Leptolyngbyaceae cyanobacterium bins.302]
MQPNIRRCVVCRKLAPKQEFWRVVRVHPSHAIVLDEGMGRSAYLCREEACLKAAQKKNRLGKALKATVPEATYHELTYRLSKDYFAKNEHRR